jgi:hypothetical protein
MSKMELALSKGIARTGSEDTLAIKSPLFLKHPDFFRNRIATSCHPELWYQAVHEDDDGEEE